MVHRYWVFALLTCAEMFLSGGGHVTVWCGGEVVMLAGSVPPVRRLEVAAAGSGAPGRK